MSATLKAEQRRTGSRFARRLRGAGRIPATIQGGGSEHVDLSIDAQEFWTARRGHEHLFDIELESGAETAVIRELQWDTFGSEIVHIEFRRVKRGEKTESEVELEFVGVPAGQLNHLVTHITIRSVPSLIPDSIEVRVDGLEVGSHLRASQLILPEGVELAVDPNTEVAVISAFRGDDPEPGEGDGQAEAAATPTPGA